MKHKLPELLKRWNAVEEDLRRCIREATETNDWELCVHRLDQGIAAATLRGSVIELTDTVTDDEMINNFWRKADNASTTTKKER